MDRKTRLDHGVLCRLGFRYEGCKWYHVQDERFSIRLAKNSFYVSFFGFESEFPYTATVRDLEKLYFDKTNKWLFSGNKMSSDEK